MEYCNSFGYYSWRKSVNDGCFEYAEIRHRTHGIKSLLADLKNPAYDSEQQLNAFYRLLTHLRTDIARGSCGILRRNAFRYKIGTKKIIEDYIEAIQTALTTIAHYEDVSKIIRYDYLNECLKAHGKTALLLSGGQSLSLYHLGVCRFLHSMGFLPRVICGAGTAAVIASFVCCNEDAALKDLLDPTKKEGKALDFEAFLAKSKQPGGAIAKAARRIRRLIETGTLMDINVVAEFTAKHLGDITFKEAYEKTGRVLNIVISNLRECHTMLPHTDYTISQPLLGNAETRWVANYLTAPDVLVRTACVAAVSHGLFGSWLWKGYALKRKNAKTGEIEVFSPCAYSSTRDTAEATAMNRLSEQFNVTCVIRATTKFTLFSTMASPVARELTTSKLTQVLERGRDEVTNEFWYRVYTTLKFLRTVPLIGPGIRRVLSLDVFLKDTEADVELCAYTGLAFNFLKHPSQEFVNEGLREGEKSTWPMLSTLQLHLAVEDTFEDVLNELLAEMTEECETESRTGKYLLFPDFPFPQLIDCTTKCRTSSIMPFPHIEELGRDDSVISDAGSSIGESLTYGCGFGSMIMRHVDGRRSSGCETPKSLSPKRVFD
eukprot:TRINITY_DN13702_c0_g1_i1.p1 TRINITY_DN13702_c0_g1~~TRINITY_DN13702_c0_g1_i1.p1  ORF type:complete len:614 (+),score=217.92 TRINITY_DN13702_c0_g1_i1:35-1843(+)